MIQSLKKRFQKEERHNRNLKKSLVRKKNLPKLSMEGEAVPVKVMDALTKDGLFRLAEDVGIDEGDIIFVTRTDGWGRNVVRDLADAGVGGDCIRSTRSAAGDPRCSPPSGSCVLLLLSAMETRAQVQGKMGLVPEKRRSMLRFPLEGGAGAAGTGEEIGNG